MRITIVRSKHTFSREDDRAIATQILGYRMVERAEPSMWHTDEKPDIRRWYELRDESGKLVKATDGVWNDTRDEDTVWACSCPDFGHWHDSLALIAELALRGWLFSVGEHEGRHVATVTPPGRQPRAGNGDTRAQAVKRAVLATIGLDR